MWHVQNDDVDDPIGKVKVDTPVIVSSKVGKLMRAVFGRQHTTDAQ